MKFRSLLFVAGFFALARTTPAVAQIDPDDTGLGTKLGMQQQHNSGEVGTVTLYRRGSASTLVVLQIASEPPGRSQPAHIHRGRSCEASEPKPAYGLAPAINGVSRTLVEAPEAKLLSGNYVVKVDASSGLPGRYVSCGELYR